MLKEDHGAWLLRMELGGFLLAMAMLAGILGGLIYWWRRSR